VRFLGFNNMEEKELDDLFLSKGEERRKEQEERSEGGIREDEIHDLIAKNCPDLLSNFGEPGDGVEDLDLGKLSMSTKSKKSKSKSSSKNESSMDRSLHVTLTSEFSEEQVRTEMIGEGGSVSSKESRKREKKQKKRKEIKEGKNAQAKPSPAALSQSQLNPTKWTDDNAQPMGCASRHEFWGSSESNGSNVPTNYAKHAHELPAPFNAQHAPTSPYVGLHGPFPPLPSPLLVHGRL